jgi:DNA repair exonuclease SbcCD ATPase subunit
VGYQDALLKLNAEFSVLTASKKKHLHDIASTRFQLEQAKENAENAVTARAILQRVAQQTQSKLEFRISSLVTTALAAVFPDPYKFEVRFEERRNKVECDLMFSKNGELFKPVDCAGGGAVDIASFALRLSFWSLTKTRPLIILDEPFKFVSVDLQPACSEMLKTISERLGVQVIMISHLPELIGCADRVFEVRLRGDKSVVEMK